ncbi:MAG: response regulator [Alphaproteobacteria bacterium]|nr:response regulator [Alphaproteobacteria bacterium]
MTELVSILYVEDDPDIQAMTKLTLKRRGGFDVRTADSGNAALKELKKNPPQLLMLDVMMPGMDGPATLRAIRELPEGGSIPAIFITAKVQKHEVAAYEAMGCIGVISKPFDAMTLTDTIQEMWKKHLEGNSTKDERAS